jgi:uncharacterized membrane protein YedE/YeeE
MFGTDPAWLMIGGLVAGLLFGVLLQRGGVATYRVIVGQFLLVDFTVAKVMFTAIVVGALGVYGMLALGLIDGLQIKPAYLVGVGLGGTIFGVGMTTLGYCPGTAVAAVATGSRHAAVGILGGVVGAGLYSALFPSIEGNLLKLEDFGKVTVPDLFGFPPALMLGALVVGAILMFAAITRWERGQTPVEAP